mgnify:CR=1 FL=1
MGTNFTLLIDHENEKFARIAAKKALSEAHRLDRILSDYDSESELSKLSQNLDRLQLIKFSFCYS